MKRYVVIMCALLAAVAVAQDPPIEEAPPDTPRVAAGRVLDAIAAREAARLEFLAADDEFHDALMNASRSGVTVEYRRQTQPSAGRERYQALLGIEAGALFTKVAVSR